MKVRNILIRVHHYSNVIGMKNGWKRIFTFEK